MPANWSALAGNAAKPSINIGDMKNRGIDFSIGWRDKVGEFGYNISANISRYVNEVTRLGSSDLFNTPPVTTTMIMEQLGAERGWPVPALITMLTRLSEKGFVYSESLARNNPSIPSIFPWRAARRIRRRRT